MIGILDKLNNEVSLTNQVAKVQFCNRPTLGIHQHAPEKLKRHQVLEQELPTFLSIAVDIQVILNKHLEIINCSNGFSHILGWEESEILGKNYMDFIEYPESIQIITAINKHKEDEKVATAIAKCKCKDGKYKWIEWRGKYVAEKEVHLVTGRDITMQKEQEDKRLAEREAAELDVLKNEFLINMSHELKTPFNIIYSTLQLESKEIKDVLKNNGQGMNLKILKQHDRIIQRNVYRLLRLVRNLTELSRLEAPHYRLHLINCNIVDVIRQISFAIRNHMSESRMKLSFHSEVQELIMACNPPGIEQIMLNLISNDAGVKT